MATGFPQSLMIERIIVTGQVVPFLFEQDALAANQADVQLTAPGAASSIEGITLPFSGYIVGIVANLSTAASAGSLTVGATVDGTENAATRLTFSTQTALQKTFKVGVNAPRVAAGSLIGAEITTDSSWNGTTADLLVTIYVLLDMDF